MLALSAGGGADVAIYDRIGAGYAGRRRPDPRIARRIEEALSDVDSVVNVGAGTGSYEPAGRRVLAVEPSQLMRRQRPPGAAPCVAATAERLPLADGAFEAAMAILTIHHWSDLAAGLREMRRVARRRIVLMTWAPEGPPFWLTRDYFPQIAAMDRAIFPGAAELRTMLGPGMRTSILPIPHDCVDGFQAAYWRRPQAYLDEEVRSAISSFSRFDSAKALEKLRGDIASGRWAAANADLLAAEEADFGYRIVTCDLGS